MRTHALTAQEYETVIEGIFDTYHQYLLDCLQEGYSEFDYYEEQYTMSDFLGDAWHEEPLKNATYDSITQSISIDDYEEVAIRTQELPWHDGPNQIIDDLTYHFVKQDLYERLEDFKTNYALLLVLQKSLHDLIDDTPPEYDNAEAAHSAFSRWFLRERKTEQATPASELDPIDQEEFTSAHFELEELLHPDQVDLLIAVAWWLESEHPDRLDDLARIADYDFSDFPELPTR